MTSYLETLTVKKFMKMRFFTGPCQPVSGCGGVFQNLGPLPFQGPPQKNFFRKAKIFPKTKVPKIFRKTTFFQKFPKFSAKKSFIFKKFCNSSMPGPSPRKLGPSPQVGPTPPPPQVARPWFFTFKIHYISSQNDPNITHTKNYIQGSVAL